MEFQLLLMMWFSFNIAMEGQYPTHADSNLILDYTETFKVRNWRCQCNKENAYYTEICVGGYYGHCGHQRPSNIKPNEYEICKKADMMIQERGGSIREPTQGIMHLVSLLQTEFSNLSTEILLKFGFSEDEIKYFKTYANNSAFQQKFHDERIAKALEEERIRKKAEEAQKIKVEEAQKRWEERRQQEIAREKKEQQELDAKINGPNMTDFQSNKFPRQMQKVFTRYSYKKQKDEILFSGLYTIHENETELKNRIGQATESFTVKYHGEDYHKDINDQYHYAVTFSKNMKVLKVTYNWYYRSRGDRSCDDIQENQWQNLKIFSFMEW